MLKLCNHLHWLYATQPLSTVSLFGLAQLTQAWSMYSWTPPCDSFLALYALLRSLDCQFSPTSNHQPSEGNLIKWSLCWLRSSCMIVGQSTMISLTHHNNDWHPESLYGVPWLQPTSKVNGRSPGIGSGGQCPPGGRPHNPATWFHPPTTTGLFWTIFVLVKGTAGPVERLGALQTLICAPVVRPNVPHCRILPFN